MPTTAELKQAGFSDAEIKDYADRRTAIFSNAGFSQQEITSHFNKQSQFIAKEEPKKRKKGLGFFGELKLPNGRIATEFSIGVNFEGKETEIPTLVPTLTKTELDLMLNDIIPNQKEIPNIIVRKAVDHAKRRIGQGKSPFKIASNQSRFVAREEPGIIGETLERARSFITEKTGLFAPDISPIGGAKFREEQPFTTLGQAAIHHGAETLSGLGLRIPDVLASKFFSSDTLAEALDKLTGFIPTPKGKSIGEAVKFVGELKTLGLGITPAVAKIPARQALKTILSTGLTFGTRAANEAVAKKITKGEPIRLQGIHFESGIGVLFGAGSVGIAKFAQFIKGLKGLPKAQVRPARAEVNATLKHFKATGDRTQWDAVRIKYGGISQAGAERIRARTTPPPPVKDFGKFPLAKRPAVAPAKAIVPVAKPTTAVKKPPEAPPAQKVAEITAPEKVIAPKIAIPMVTDTQKAKVHILAREKGFLSKKGKVKPQYRRLAKAMTGQTSIAKMTKEQAGDFINAINRLPEPRMVRGELVPPSIPITTRLAVRGQFQRKFKEPTPFALITDPSFYANKLGVKSLVEPLERAKQDFDFEYRNAARELDKQGIVIDKVGKTTAREKLAAKIKNVPTKAREEIGRLLDKHETAPADLNPQKAKIFNYFRGLTRTMLIKQNEAREKLGWPIIPGRKAYMRRIATDISKEMLAGKYPFPEGVKFWSGINTGEKVFNPMEFRRKLEDDVFDLFVKDPVQASKAMMYNALKEIHLNQPLKFYKQQLNAVGKDLPEYKNLLARERAELDKTMVMPAATRRWLTEYVNTSILGRQSKVDELVNNIVTKSGMRGIFNKLLTPFGRTVGRKPITDFFRRVGRAQMAGVLGPRPRIIIRNKFQLTQNLALYTNKANARAFGPPNKELSNLLDQSRFLRDYTGLEDLPVDIAGKIEKLWHSAYQWSARSNARQAMEVAYWDTKELIDNPKYQKHGWKQEHLLKEMEFGASATQFHYTALGMPQIFRHKTLLPMTRLTSWWMNYFSKFHREAIHRAFTGRPSWAGTDGPTLPWSRRLGWLRYVIIGGAILNTMGYTRSFLFGAAPTGWPPAMQFSWNAYLYTVSQDEKQKAIALKKMGNAAKTFIPGYIAFKDFSAVWSGRKDLSSLLFYKKVKK